MLFSILIPVYNAEKYVRASVQSALAQTERDFEIVLCDDASTDGSLTLCEELEKKHPGLVRVVRNPENQGQLLTRRHLFASSKGEYIVCLDADDELEPNALSALKEAIFKTGADMIVYNALCVHTDQKTEHFKPSLQDNHLYQGEKKTVCLEAIYQNSYLNSLCTKAFKRELLDLSADYSQWKGLTLGEDLFQSYPLFDRAERIYYLNQDLYRYYKRENGMTAGFNPRFYSMRKILWEREDQYLAAWGLGGEAMEKCCRKRCNEIINYAVNTAANQPRHTFREEMERIRQDGFLSSAWERARLTGRYRWYGRLLLSGNFSLLYAAVRVESAVMH